MLSSPSQNPKKRLVLMLRAQLPYSRERDWLFRVLTESYLPLLKMLGGLADEGVEYRITLAFPETLRSMLDDPALQRRYVPWLEDEISIAEAECARHENIPPLLVLAREERDRLVAALKTFTHDWRCDLPQQWRRLAASGHVEIAATAATGASLPGLEPQPEFLRAQVRLGKESAPSAIGFLPPEGAISPAAAREIAEAGFQWVAAECSDPTLFKTTDGLVVLPTNAPLRWLIEDAKTGYPAASVYRSFHSRLPLKYYAGGVDHERITVIYEHARAQPVVEKHAAEFIEQLGDFTALCLEMESFGHWWLEGVSFLENLLRRSDTISFLSPGDLIKTETDLPVRKLPVTAKFPVDPDITRETSFVLMGIAALSSGGELNDDSLPSRALRQAIRECLLSQSSDWKILREADPDGLGRSATHEVTTRLQRARDLVESVRNDTPSEVFVSQCEASGPVFLNLDWRGMLSRL